MKRKIKSYDPKQKIDTETIAVEIKKLNNEEKEKLYFIIKGMQLSRGIQEIKEMETKELKKA